MEAFSNYEGENILSKSFVYQEKGVTQFGVIHNNNISLPETHGRQSILFLDKKNNTGYFIHDILDSNEKRIAVNDPRFVSTVVQPKLTEDDMKKILEYALYGIANYKIKGDYFLIKVDFPSSFSSDDYRHHRDAIGTYNLNKDSERLLKNIWGNQKLTNNQYNFNLPNPKYGKNWDKNTFYMSDYVLIEYSGLCPSTTIAYDDENMTSSGYVPLPNRMFRFAVNCGSTMMFLNNKDYVHSQPILHTENTHINRFPVSNSLMKGKKRPLTDEPEKRGVKRTQFYILGEDLFNHILQEIANAKDTIVTTKVTMGEMSIPIISKEIIKNVDGVHKLVNGGKKRSRYMRKSKTKTKSKSRGRTRKYRGHKKRIQKRK
jgi:hypothetical protein